MTATAQSALSRMRSAASKWAASTGIRVVWADQDGPRPASPFLTLRLSGLESVHEDALQPPDTAGHAHIAGSREAVLTVQVYGSNAIAQASRLALSAHLPQPDLDSLGVCIVSVEQLGDVSALMDDAIEPRAVLDVVLRASSDIEDVTGLIESVTVTSELNAVARTLNIN